jgi:hypothetical protein
MSQQILGAHNMYVPSVREMRGDQRLQWEAEETFAEMDVSYLGNEQYITSKKARGLLRAGGPHDHILVGPDKERVFYKNLNMEQWAYGYTCILESQVNQII